MITRYSISSMLSEFTKRVAQNVLKMALTTAPITTLWWRHINTIASQMTDNYSLFNSLSRWTAKKIYQPRFTDDQGIPPQKYWGLKMGKAFPVMAATWARDVLADQVDRKRIAIFAAAFVNMPISWALQPAAQSICRFSQLYYMTHW